MNRTYIFYNVYTIGDATKDWKEIVDLSAFKVKNGQVVGDFHTFVKPFEHLPDEKELLIMNTSYEELARSPDYFNAITDFIRWADYNSIFVSWSKDDLNSIVLNNDMNGIYDFPQIKNMFLQEEYQRAAHLTKAPKLRDITRVLGSNYHRYGGFQTMDFAFNMIAVANVLWKKPFLQATGVTIIEGDYKEVVIDYYKEKVCNSPKRREEGEALRFLRAEREQRLAGAFS